MHESCFSNFYQRNKLIPKFGIITEIHEEKGLSGISAKDANITRPTNKSQKV
jgi:hypothetical protein